MLTPVTDEDGAPFWEYAAQGELRVQSCADCGELRFPPRPCCPHCHSFASEWRPMSGRGRIWSYVLPHPPLLPEYAAQAPTTRWSSNSPRPPHPPRRQCRRRARRPLNSVDPSRLRIGAAVKVAFAEIDGVVVPRWLLERG